MNLVSLHCLLLESEEQEQLNEQLEKFCKSDTLGIDVNENDVHAKFLEDLKSRVSDTKLNSHGKIPMNSYQTITNCQ